VGIDLFFDETAHGLAKHLMFAGEIHGEASSG
jgi:hypothetical protein